MDVLTVKFLHILSAIVLFGLGMGTAFHGLMNNLSRDVRAAAISNRSVVWADWIFTTPTVIIQPLTGFWLAYLQGWPLLSGWVFWSLLIYAVAGACWLPVVWLQVRMRRMAEEAARAGAESLPPLYYTYLRIWTALGVPAFIGMVAIVWLMVTKPGG